MVDFEWFRSFVAVYKTGTVSAAAVQRLMTQPAISQHLGALEHALNLQLFERTPRQMVPTEFGKLVYAQVIDAVEQLERLSRPTALRLDDLPLDIHVGVPREYFYAEGLQCLPNPAKSSYRLNVVLGQTHDLMKQMDAGQLHAIIATQRISRRTLHYQPLQVEHFILVASPELKVPIGISGDDMLSWLELQPWIVYASDLPIVRRYWQEVFGKRPKITPFLVVPDLVMILRAVAQGLGVSILPEYLCRDALNRKEIQILWHPESVPSNQLYIACLRERLHEKEVHWFIKHCVGSLFQGGS